MLVNKIFNNLSIKAFGLNGNSFSDGKIEQMQLIANKVSEFKIERNKSKPNEQKLNTIKEDIKTEMTYLGEKSGYFNKTSTRSSVVMATLIAFSLSDSKFNPTQISDINQVLKTELGVDSPSIANDPAEKAYFAEALDFAKKGYKSTFGTDPHRKLHQIFATMGGAIAISESSLFGFDKKSKLLSLNEISKLVTSNTQLTAGGAITLFLTADHLPTMSQDTKDNFKTIYDNQPKEIQELIQDCILNKYPKDVKKQNKLKAIFGITTLLSAKQIDTVKIKSDRNVNIATTLVKTSLRSVAGRQDLSRWLTALKTFKSQENNETSNLLGTPSEALTTFCNGNNYHGLEYTLLQLDAFINRHQLDLNQEEGQLMNQMNQIVNLTTVTTE